MKNVRYFSQPDYFTLVTYTYTHIHIFIYVCMIASPKAVWCHMPLDSIWNIFILSPLVRVLTLILACHSLMELLPPSQPPSWWQAGFRDTTFLALIPHLNTWSWGRRLTPLAVCMISHNSPLILSWSKISTLIGITAQIGSHYTPDRYYTVVHKVSHWGCRRNNDCFHQTQDQTRNPLHLMCRDPAIFKIHPSLRDTCWDKLILDNVTQSLLKFNYYVLYVL